jgi:hypothetical protein
MSNPRSVGTVPAAAVTATYGLGQKSKNLWLDHSSSASWTNQISLVRIDFTVLLHVHSNQNSTTICALYRIMHYTTRRMLCKAE